MAMGEAEYLAQRLDDQINWYEKKSAANQTSYKRLRLIEIIAAASIPLLAGYRQESVPVGMTIGVLGLIVAVLAGIVSLYRFQENWNEYRAVAESLKQEDPAAAWFATSRR
jgi:CHASE3 domain sensor protein